MGPLGVQDADPRRAGMLETAGRLEARPDKAGTGVIGEPDRGWAKHGQNGKPRGR